MKISNKNLLPMFDSLSALSNKKLGTKLKFLIAKNLLVINPIKQAFITACRIDTNDGVKGYIEGQKNGISRQDLDQQYPGVGDYLAAKEAEIEDLLKVEMDLDLSILSMKDFPDEIDFDLLPLMPILEE